MLVSTVPYQFILELDFNIAFSLLHLLMNIHTYTFFYFRYVSIIYFIIFLSILDLIIALHHHLFVDICLLDMYMCFIYLFTKYIWICLSVNCLNVRVSCQYSEM